MKEFAKKLLLLVLALTCTLPLLASCDSEATEPPVSDEPTPTPTPEVPATPENSEPSNDGDPTPSPESVVLTDFERYQSNTSGPSGHNSALKSETAVTETFRGVFPIQEYGKLDYKFFFSNNVNSTYASGSNSYREMETSAYTIESAYVAVSRSPLPLRTLDNKQAVLFDGQATRNVEPKETFWSDALSVDVPENQFLVFEWTVTYTVIPSTIVSTTLTGLKKTEPDKESFAKVGELPLPDLVGCDRGAKVRVGFIGDSITMGEFAGTEYWVAQIADGLGDDVSVWNLGLGYARGDDAANSPSWLYKAKQCDVVGICFGVNDINSGAYQTGRPASKDELLADIAKIAAELKEAGCEVIIFSTPPYTFSTDEKIIIWQDTIEALASLAEEKGYAFFDFAACLGTEGSPSTPAYGGHPNAEGCKVVADAFLAADLIKIPE